MLGISIKIANPRLRWPYLGTLLVAFFAAAASLLFIIIAAIIPRWLWIEVIANHELLDISSAKVLIQFIAKAIEVAFVTSYLAFLGQVLSRKASERKEEEGEPYVRLADLCMRDWVASPGSIITNVAALITSGRTLLGLLTLLTLGMSLLYGTAASALVAPMVRSLPEQRETLSVSVFANYASDEHIRRICPTPINATIPDDLYDKADVARICQSIAWAAQGQASLHGHATRWKEELKINSSVAMATELRPSGFETLEFGTTIQSTWLNPVNYEEAYHDFGRIVDNVTLAVPHPSVMDAEHAPHRNLMRPDDLKDRVSYQLSAAVPSPFVNVVCANANKSDIKDLVYEGQPGVVLNSTRDWQKDHPWTTWGFDWPNFDNVQTPLDKIFDWSNNNQARPVFYKFPFDRNTILNNTEPATKTDRFYLLGKTTIEFSNDEYFLCSIRSGITVSCSTRYSVARGGKMLRANCEDAADEWQYSRRNHSRVQRQSFEWYHAGASLAHEVKLGSGDNEGNAPVSHYLTQLALRSPALSSKLPSPAEALASIMAPAAWLAAKDSPVVEYWDHDVPELARSINQTFEASIRGVGYMSGGDPNWKRLGYLPLSVVCAMSCGLLIYLGKCKGFEPDLTEIASLFVFAMASPPPSTVRMQQTDGNPTSEVYEAKWYSSSRHTLLPGECRCILKHRPETLHLPLLELSADLPSHARTDGLSVDEEGRSTANDLSRTASVEDRSQLLRSVGSGLESVAGAQQVPHTPEILISRNTSFDDRSRLLSAPATEVHQALAGSRPQNVQHDSDESGIFIMHFNE